MDYYGTEPTNPPLQSPECVSAGERQWLEERTVSESSFPEVATVVGSAVQEPCLPADSNLFQQQGNVEYEGVQGSSGGSQNGSGSSCDSDFDADMDERLFVSAADLIDAYNNALEELQLGNQKETNTLVWINKCQVTISSVSNELSKFATGVVGSCAAGDVNVQSILREGNPPHGGVYEQRFQAVEEYVLATERYFAVQEKSKLVQFKAETGCTEGPSEGMTATNSKDLMESVMVDQGYAGTCGEMKAKSSRDGGKSETPEEKLEAKRRRLSSNSDEGAMSAVKRGAWTAEKSAAGEVVNPMGVKQEVTSEDVTNSEGGGAAEEVGAESTGDLTSPISKDNVGRAVEESNREPTASTNSSVNEVRQMEVHKQYAGEEACKRAQVIRKLVTRQREALTRMTVMAEARLHKIFSECHFLVTCVKCAGYVCNSAMDAHGMAQLALKIAASSCPADVVGTASTAVVAACQNTDMAVGSCERAVQLHKDAVRVLEQAMASLFATQDDKLLGERTVSEVTRAADDIRQYVDQRADVNLHDLANKLSVMESMIGTLSHVYQRAKDVNALTKQLAKRFDDAAFRTHIVAAVFSTAYFVLKTMTAATNALEPLS